MAGSDFSSTSHHEPFKRDKASASLGQVSDEPLTFTNDGVITVTNASGTLLAAGTGNGRQIWIKVPITADTGICINFGGAAATTSTQLVEPGETVFIPCEQAITAIRAGSTNVSVYVSHGVV